MSVNTTNVTETESDMNKARIDGMVFDNDTLYLGIAEEALD